MSEKPPAIKVAESQTDSLREIERGGVRALLLPVGEGAIEEATGRVQPPPVPIVQSGGTEYANEADPHYLHELSMMDFRRGQAAAETMVLLGVQLLDPVPDGKEVGMWFKWQQRLKMLARRGIIDLDWADWGDELDLEFLFKRYLYVTIEDLNIIGQLTGMSQTDLEVAARSFQGDAQ